MGKRLNILSNSCTYGVYLLGKGDAKRMSKQVALKDAQVFCQLSPILGHK